MIPFAVAKKLALTKFLICVTGDKIVLATCDKPFGYKTKLSYSLPNIVGSACCSPVSFNALATPGLAKNCPSEKGLVAPVAILALSITSFLTPLPASMVNLFAGSITSTGTKSVPNNSLASSSLLAKKGFTLLCPDLNSPATSSFFFIRSL